MKALVLRELKSVFCSPAGVFFALAFFFVSGFMLWLFPGSYNIIDGGYADMSRFFNMVPVLLIILIPALTMRLYSEESRNKTIDILISRPVYSLGIYLSKFSATFLFVLVTLLCTGIYIYFIYQLANPLGNIDMGSIVASYFSLILLTVVFIGIGLLGSAITRNQIVALVVSIFICLFVFYGFDLLSGLFISGKAKAVVASLGLNYHYELMRRGVIQVSNVLAVFNLLILFVLLFFITYRVSKRMVFVCLFVISVLNFIFFFIPDYRLDFSADRRYTLSDYSINLLKNLDKDQSLAINIYLTGDLNYGFQRLRNETDNILNDFDRFANGHFIVNYIYPYSGNKASNDVQQDMVDNGMPGIMLNETDREGKLSRKIIYPYASITNNKDTLIVPLLKNIAGNTAEENLNISIESLEYEFIDAIRLLNQVKTKAIAFVEGHDELSRASLYDAEELLSKYYSVNRGEIGNDINILDDFDAVIIAGPLSKFNNTEKYVLDQYIMRGGKVLWLIDGAFYSHEELARLGHSASIKNDLNLDDMLFSYGVRINPDLIQDMQCVSAFLVTNDSQSTVLVPSYYQPLLMPSFDFSVTKNIRDVKAGFASSIDIVNNSPNVRKNILLTTSGKTHLVKVPEPINFDVSDIQEQPAYFSQAYVPVAVSLEGEFNSVFVNRVIPDSIKTGAYKTIQKSQSTRMIVVSSSDIITNELQGQGKDTQVLPMGYDRASNQLFGNREFIVNAINWLTDDEGLMQLKTKQQRMYLLNKSAAYENRDRYAILSILIPIAMMSLIMGSVFLYRKRKYENDRYPEISI
ncbi:MAG: gliding motility-associated ABC transporter substrate-binding protein GldG [Prevotella sp.]|jgi:ABC-2 type transport system permease protein|nr:gliding motility-associated ABC transporter substrate-binding protein GldG [Prevotella sp.]